MSEKLAETEKLAAESLLKLGHKKDGDAFVMPSVAHEVSSCEDSGGSDAKEFAMSLAKTNHIPHQTVCKVKQNRSKVIAVTFPHGDVRNSYAECFFKAANVGELSQIVSTLTSLCTPDVKIVCRYKVKDNNYAAENIEADGVPAVAAVVASMTATVPDAMVQITAKQVEVYRNGESVLTVRWKLKGTVVYGYHGVETGSNVRIVVSAETATSSSATPSTTIYSGSSNSSRSDDLAIVTDGLETLQVNATVIKKVVDPQTGKCAKVESQTKLSEVDKRESVVEIDWLGTNTFYINKSNKVYLIVSESGNKD